MVTNYKEKSTFSWYPGHMLKAERELKKIIPLVDLIVEVLDARAPASTRNKRLNSIINKKPQIVILNKRDLAEEEVTQSWVKSYINRGITCLASDKFTKSSSKRLLSALIKKNRECYVSRKTRNRSIKPLRVMIIGMPNVGKSTLINQIACRRKTITGPLPGVTRNLQWVKLTEEIELLDTPGVTMPRIESLEIGLKLVLLSVVTEKLTPPEEVADYLYTILREKSEKYFFDSYGIKEWPSTISHLLETIGRKRGIIKSGGVIDKSRAAKVFINDFRKAKLGIISFEPPENHRETYAENGEDHSL